MKLPWKQTLEWLAHGLRAYAHLTKLWPLYAGLFFWCLYGTPYLLIDEREDNDLWTDENFICTYRGPWSEHTTPSINACDLIIFIKEPWQ